MIENSLKIVRAFGCVQVEGIFKYHELCKFLIALAFTQMPIYYNWENCKWARF